MVEVEGPRAKHRIAEVTFEAGTDEVIGALEAASVPSLSVASLSARLDAADSALEKLVSSAADLGAETKADGIAVTQILEKRRNLLRRRLASLGACAKSAKDAALHDWSALSADQLRLLVAALEETLEALAPEVAEAAPEAQASRQYIAAVKEALKKKTGRAEANKKKRDNDKKISAYHMNEDAPGPREARPAFAKTRQEEEDALFARRLQRELAREQEDTPQPQVSLSPEEPEEEVVDWLSPREKEYASKFASVALRCVVATASDRERMLEKGVCVLKFKASKKCDWKWLRLQGKKKLIWQPLPGNLARSALSQVRSEGCAGLALEAIIKVTIGPEAPRASFVDAAHYGAQFHVPSRWGYLTLNTRDRDYVFAFCRDEAMTPTRESGCGVIDPFFAEVLDWATSIERLADAARGHKRAFGEGCLSRAQRIYSAEVNDLGDEAGTSPLFRLCPALRPLAHVMAKTIEAHRLAAKSVGCAFGSRAPDFLFEQGSWLPMTFLDAPIPPGYRAVIVSNNETPGFLCGQLALENAFSRGGLLESHPAVGAIAAFAASHNLRRTFHQPQREETLSPVALFAACARLDGDDVEALVKFISVDVRYASDKSWKDTVGDRLGFMEPQTGMTPLCFVITWCDVLGEREAALLVRRLLKLGANPSLDDQHPKVSFSPLASATANGALDIVRSLLAAGADVNVRTSDGRTCLHLLSLAKEGKRRPLVQILVDAGADVDAPIPATGDTPLFLAAKDGLVDVVKALIEHAANALRTNAAGLTPSEAAYLELRIIDDNQKEHQAAAEATLAEEDKKANIALCAAFLATTN